MYPLFLNMCIILKDNPNNYCKSQAVKVWPFTGLCYFCTGCSTIITLEIPEPETRPWFMAMIS